MRKLVYISGKIANGGKSPQKEENKNIEHARQVALKVWGIPGIYVFLPHLNSPWRNQKELLSVFKTEPYDTILQADLDFMQKVDIMLMLTNWQESKGAIKEHDCAKKHGIPICYSVAELQEFMKKYHPTCSFCGRLRKGLKNEHSLKICKDCYPQVSQLVRTIQNKDNHNFIKIPRNP